MIDLGLAMLGTGALSTLTGMGASADARAQQEAALAYNAAETSGINAQKYLEMLRLRRQQEAGTTDAYGNRIYMTPTGESRTQLTGDSQRLAEAFRQMQLQGAQSNLQAQTAESGIRDRYLAPLTKRYGDETLAQRTESPTNFASQLRALGTQDQNAQLNNQQQQLGQRFARGLQARYTPNYSQYAGNAAALQGGQQMAANSQSNPNAQLFDAFSQRLTGKQNVSDLPRPEVDTKNMYGNQLQAGMLSSQQPFQMPYTKADYGTANTLMDLGKLGMFANAMGKFDGAFAKPMDGVATMTKPDMSSLNEMSNAWNGLSAWGKF